MPAAERRCLAQYFDRVATFVLLGQGKIEFVGPRNLLQTIALNLEVPRWQVDLWLP
jgi:hypothetical protein